MAFNSLYFIFLFLPVSLLLYCILPARFRPIPMVLFSLLFFAWGKPSYIVLLLFSILYSYAAGLQIAALKNAGRKGLAKASAICAVIINLLMLGFFRYQGFLVSNLNMLSGLKLTSAELALPMGISFFTFTVISYIIDVYRGNAPVQKNPLLLSEYISFFPKLSAGPIVRYADMQQQLENPEPSAAKFGAGVNQFLVGLAKKVLLADVLGAWFTAISAQTEMAALTAWLGIVLYALQLYFDFSGYSDMAIGLSKMFGFDFTKNFDHPYTSASVGEFWNRWHISLADWFKHYVYFPLGGSRVSRGKTIRNIVVVWLCIGLWHGASWSFVIWGLYHCGIILLEKFVLKKPLSKIPHSIRVLLTGFFICLAWPLFFSGTLSGAIRYYGVMFGISSQGIVNSALLYYLKSALLPMLAGIIGLSPIVSNLHGRLCYRHGGTALYCSIAVYLVLFVLCIACIISTTYTPFLYLQF